MSGTSFKMTRKLAVEIKDLRINGSSFRMVAQRFADRYPGLPVTAGSQIEGQSLCEEASNLLEENHWDW
jgi:hypothetical protein